MKLSTHAIASLDLCGPDCTDTGWLWTLYSDGHLAAQYSSRWQGSRTGQRYVTGPGHVDLSQMDPSNPDTDADALLSEAVRGVNPAGDRAFRRTRAGYVVR